MSKQIEQLQKEIERLKKELKKQKKYGLVWEDKTEEVVEMCKQKLPVLKEVKNKEIITDKNKPVNLLIEGDNYHALSVLNYTHAGKVDVIYIDPPYNTGNKDFIFNDHYVDREDTYRHSKWLSFMEKRLKLAKNLLKDTGVIFISIDDNEVAQLKLLMDDRNKGMFGEENLVSILIWKKKGGASNTEKILGRITEYIVCYAKNINKVVLNRRPIQRNYPFQDKKGFYKLESLIKTNLGIYKRDNLVYGVKNPVGGNVIYPPTNKRWTIGKDQMEELIKNNLLEFIKSKNGWEIKKKRYEDDEGNGNPVYLNLIIDKGSLKTAKTEMEDMFGSREIFDAVKPTQLIKHLLSISSNKNSLVLDFMAGTGTTGQAVLELNKEDGGNRQFILCTNNENNICTDVCYPRIKKVIEGYKNLKGEWVEGLSGNLKYFKTDFVDAEPTDKNKIKLTRQATEMLCVKEGTFDLVQDRGSFKIFKNSKHYTGIIFDQAAIPSFKKEIKNINGKFSVYVFSLGDETFDEEFTDVKQKVKISPIPEAILRVYRKIFK
jgi:adenine-specific DNA-methyltransferase